MCGQDWPVVWSTTEWDNNRHPPDVLMDLACIQWNLFESSGTFSGLYCYYLLTEWVQADAQCILALASRI